MQEQEKKAQKKKKERGSAEKRDKKPKITSLEPAELHQGHLSLLTLKGRNLNESIRSSIRLTRATINHIEFISRREIRLQVRPEFAETDQKILLYLDLHASSIQDALSVLAVASPLEKMAVIPEGEFTFGPPAEEQTISMPEYGMAFYEVSNIDYLQFLNYLAASGDHSKCHPDEPLDKSHVPDKWDDATNRQPDFPVHGVDWFDAYAYAAWKGMRLPTEKEWEKAARGPTGLFYSYGNKPDNASANTLESGALLNRTAAYAHALSPFGLYNMSGSVWEWTSDDAEAVGNKILKGGSYRNSMLDARTYEQNWTDKLTRRDDIGFRCATNLTEEIWQAKKQAPEMPESDVAADSKKSASSEPEQDSPVTKKDGKKEDRRKKRKSDRDKKKQEGNDDKKEEKPVTESKKKTEKKKQDN